MIQYIKNWVFPVKTVDGVLKVFNSAIDDLEQIRASCSAAADDLAKASKQAADEAARAGSVVIRLKAIVS